MSSNINHTTAEENAIIKGCIKMKREFQELLYNRYAAKMFAVCLRYTHNKQDAEDLLQEGFLRVFNCINNYRNEGSLEGWIRRVFVNSAIKFYTRSSQLYSVVELNVNVQFEAIDESALSSITSEELMAMVQQLTPGYRTIFNLYAIEGFTHKEIAELLGINEGTSKSQLARARILLQKMVLAAQNYKTVQYVDCI